METCGSVLAQLIRTIIAKGMRKLECATPGRGKVASWELPAFGDD